MQPLEVSSGSGAGAGCRLLRGRESTLTPQEELLVCIYMKTIFAVWYLWFSCCIYWQWIWRQGIFLLSYLSLIVCKSCVSMIIISQVSDSSQLALVMIWMQGISQMSCISWVVWGGCIWIIITSQVTISFIELLHLNDGDREYFSWVISAE